MQLADLGAEVIKIEDPSVGGDVSRYVPPYREGTDSLFFESFNRNKRSLTLDLRHPEARSVLEDLVRVSDALVSNLRGDQPEKLRLRFADLEHLNPRLVCVSLSGFGMTGPRAGEGGYDYTVQGLTGWMQLTGGPDQPPTKSGLSLVDFCGGYVAAIATLAGVWQARRDGRGCDADLSLFETALAQLTYIGTWVVEDFEPRRMPDSAHQTMVPFQAFPTADGWIMIACPKQKLWSCSATRSVRRADERSRFADFAGAATATGTARPEARGDPSPPPDGRVARADGPTRRAERARQRRAGRVRRSAGGRARGRRRDEHPALGVVAARPRRFASQGLCLRPCARPMLGEHARAPGRGVRLRGGADPPACSSRGLRGSQRGGGLMTVHRRGRFLEDFGVGDVYRSRLGRTITETDNIWFTCLTMNTNQMHFNREYAARTEFGEPLVVSTLTLAVVIGLSVADTSENAVANLGWGDIKLPRPVFAGDTLWAESEVTAVRESRRVPPAGSSRSGPVGSTNEPRRRDRVHPELHGVQVGRSGGAGDLPGQLRALDGRRLRVSRAVGAAALGTGLRTRSGRSSVSSRSAGGSFVIAVGESGAGSSIVCRPAARTTTDPLAWARAERQGRGGGSASRRWSAGTQPTRSAP